MVDLDDSVGDIVGDTCGIDVPKRVGYIEFGRHDIGSDERSSGILGKGSEQSDLTAIHLLGIVAKIDGEEHGVVHSHDVHDEVGIANAERIGKVDMCRGAQVEPLVAVVGREDDIGELLVAYSELWHDAAEGNALTWFVDHTLGGEATAL